MRCFHPLKGFQREDGGSLVFHSKHLYTKQVEVRCGQCIGCRINRSQVWALRIMHETKMHERSCFVTLTYDDKNVPHDYGLHYEDFQKFMKRLRKEQKARFFMCGEYGEQYKRPHFHACLFGVGFDDRVLHGRSGSGAELFTSKRLERLWPFGFASVGELTLQSAQYVAGYVTKKVTGERSEYAYERVDDQTGEAFYVEHEFCHMSLKPGIGESWFQNYAPSVAAHGAVVVAGGERFSVPRYYMDKLEKRGDYFRLLTDFANAERHVDFSADSTVERLAVQEQVALARHNLKKRYVE